MKNFLDASIIIPCRGEARFIGRCLDSIIANDYPQEFLEVLVVDGRSEDDTRNIVNSYREQHQFISLLDNPKKITPAALNIGLNQARGGIIMRMDAHTIYPPDYISGLVTALRKTGADNVGGTWVTEPGSATLVARAIALALSHPFGVGNAYFRIGVPEPRRVDTVPFGCYRREVFNRLGAFDERLERNQDIEFNARLRAAGGVILLIPSISSAYQARTTLRGLARQNFQNGCWNIYTKAVNAGSLSYRHFIPLAFVGGLLLAAIAALFSTWGSLLLGLLLGSYMIGSSAVSFSLAAKHGWQYLLVLPAAFATLHFSYGLGSLWGLLTVRNWKKNNQ